MVLGAFIGKVLVWVNSYCNNSRRYYKQALLTRMNARKLPNWFSQVEIGSATEKKQYQYQGKLFHCYNNFIAIFKKFRDNHPVSVVQLNSGTFGVVFGIYRGRYTMAPISFNKCSPQTGNVLLQGHT
jgi:hypothetical protein